MSGLNVVNKVILIENVICVYKNYTNLSTSMKYLAKLRCVIEVILYLSMALPFMTQFRIDNSIDIANRLFALINHVFSTTNTIVAIILSVIYSNSFKSYIFEVDSVHKLCHCEKLYKDALNNLHKHASLAAGFCAIAVVTLIPVAINDRRREISVNKSILLNVATDLMIKYRYILESFAFISYIEVVVAGLEFLNKSVLATIAELRIRADKVCFPGELIKLSQDLERWGAARRHLANASEHLKACFGVQIGLSLFGATTFYIILTYRGICILAEKEPGFRGNGWGLIFVLGNYVVIQLMMMRAGQRARGAAERLAARLAALRTELMGWREADGCARAAAALARHMRAAPLRLRLLSGVEIKMALATEILALVASYTIVMLQFDHVV